MRPGIIIFLLIISINVTGQKYIFSPTGKMEHSQFYVDTIIKTSMKTIDKTVFIFLDNLYLDFLNFRQYFPKKYNRLLRDSLEYFLLANLTNKAIHFKRINSRLIGEELSRYENFGLKPISYFMYPFCATQCDSLVLKPSQILIIKSLTKRNSLKLRRPPNSIMKLLTSTNQILYSTRYEKGVGGDNFYINSDFEKDFNRSRHRLAFKDN